MRGQTAHSLSIQSHHSKGINEKSSSGSLCHGKGRVFPILHCEKKTAQLKSLLISGDKAAVMCISCDNYKFASQHGHEMLMECAMQTLTCSARFCIVYYLLIFILLDCRFLYLEMEEIKSTLQF